MINIRVHGSKPELDKDAEKQFRKDARKAIRDCVSPLLANVKTRLQQKRTRVAAARPGQPPALHFGRLLKSFKRLPLKIGRYKASGGVYSDHPGAGRLEFGETDATGVRTFPHPYLEPAQRETEGQIDKRLETFLDELG